MENKQTAVNFLIEKLDNNLDINHSWRTRQYIEQAKAMEKEQIINAYAHGVVNEISIYNTITGEEFYKETYGK